MPFFPLLTTKTVHRPGLDLPRIQKFSSAIITGIVKIVSTQPLKTRHTHRRIKSNTAHPRKTFTMSLASPALLPKAATPLRILAASRPTNQRYPDRRQQCMQTRTIYTAPTEKRTSNRSGLRHGSRRPAQVRVRTHQHFYTVIDCHTDVFSNRRSMLQQSNSR